MADPNTSGTACTTLATFVQMMGEDKGFEYLKALHRNINQYTKSGAAPTLAAGQGETVVGIVFQHDVTDEAGTPGGRRGSPCEGTGYEIGSISLIAGASKSRGEEVLRLGADARRAEDLATTQAFQIPSNRRPPCRRSRPTSR